MSLLTAILPTEYLEEHGPARVRELALDMASKLPFASGARWLNFFGPPLLARLGGAMALRSRLRSAETMLEELVNERVIVSLGEGPEAGDLTTEKTLPAYRELAQVLEPWLEPLFLSRTTVSAAPPRYTSLRLTENEARRWCRRFLD
ncbi:type VI immunity family protein [Archangium violaceum]|uniref:type VI immunity family protein n=1 Tax=Archangium violaceum TaxID=83451 RepID=UPI001EEFEC78|nr:type VI immunity family protein [Archangium violaceum]